ncbi:MAG: ATP-binding protein [Candidatus Fimenecus sp.]
MLDIAQNSIAAAATQIQIEVVERTDAHTLTIGIYDNGCGMTDEQVKSVLDPFYTTRTTRKVGMGVPLFKMAAEQTGGSLTVSSKVGIGTNIKAVFHTDSVDFTPLGDMASTVTTLVSMNTEIQFLYRHKVDKREFIFDTAEIREILGDVPLSEPAVVQWMREFIEENTKALYGGVTE